MESWMSGKNNFCKLFLAVAKRLVVVSECEQTKADENFFRPLFKVFCITYICDRKKLAIKFNHLFSNLT